ncbi:uncharacterized protein BDV17DRAFT_39005 [Aspergillus undulatus]|uniref:uncharacterized protein n=1 Tax=Aspergillus undulatus TaxID=1810928 RepID=UPI003CCD7027
MTNTGPTLHVPTYTTYTLQTTSPLFTTLPPEIRTQIFTYTLSPFEDNSNPYQKETYWARPGYNAPQKTCTELLRTCKAIYAETWFLPFALAEHVFYLTGRDRAPGMRIAGKNRSGRAFGECLEMVHQVHNKKTEDEGRAPLETGNIQVFAQLYMLEPGDAFQRLLNTPYLRPRQVRLTIRYTDFWHWENNRRLYIDGKWVSVVRFPESVRRFVVDFESIDRRRGEVDIIAGQAVEKWVFRRTDDRVLTAKKEDLAVSRWTGSSMFGSRRWIRDEVRPGELDYYVVTATWTVSRAQANAEKSDEHTHPAPQDTVTGSTPNSDADSRPTVRVPEVFTQPLPPYAGNTFITELDMREAGVTMGMDAAESWEAVRAYRNSRRRALLPAPPPRRVL